MLNLPMRCVALLEGAYGGTKRVCGEPVSN